MIFGGFEISRFADGDPDLWPVAQSSLPDGGAINSPGKELCEIERDHLISTLAGHAMRKNISFSITPPESVYYTNERLFDQWAYGRSTGGSGYGIQIPRHTVTARPAYEDSPIEFRQEVPAFLIATSMAHELSHHDRRLEMPERFKYVYDYSSDPEDIREEELLTDADAYWLLHKKGFYLTPDDYLSTVAKEASYVVDLSYLLAEVDSNGPIR